MVTVLENYENHVIDERVTRMSSARNLPDPLRDGVSWCREPSATMLGTRFAFTGASHALDSLRAETYAVPCPYCLREMQRVLENASVRA